MPLKTFLRCALAVSMMAPLYAAADPFNAKPGAWEMTTVTVTTGAFIPPEAAAKMSPEERARTEKQLQEISGKPNTLVRRACITQQELDRALLAPLSEKDNCTEKIVSTSATKIQLVRTCSPPLTATWIVEAQTPERMTVSADLALPNGAKLHVESKGKWLGASCEK